MNGAEALIATLADCGLTHCFANPGTSEMYFVTALDREPRIRPVLCLLENVATGAADGFARIAERPALSLLHLGPGYLNGGANLHNGKKAFAPSITVIGDQATFHRVNDPPLTEDVVALAKPLANWIESVDSVERMGPAAAEAYAASLGPPGGNAILVVPADSSWKDGGERAPPKAQKPRIAPKSDVTAEAVKAIRAAKKPMVLAGANALIEPGLSAAARLEAAGVHVLCDMFFSRLDRGAGHFTPERLGYFPEMVVARLSEADLLVIAGSRPPVAFFAYPEKPSMLVPESCATLLLGGPESDAAATLAALANALGAPANGLATQRMPMDAQKGPLNPFAIGACLARRLPSGAIITDDAISGGIVIYNALANAPRHSWLCGVGGSIGSAIPNAIGAAFAAPQHKVIALSGDGSAMYACQSLWTIAREQLDVLTLVIANRAYRILEIELMRAATPPGPASKALLSLDNPAIDWVKLSESQGVPGVRCTTGEELDAALARAMETRGPLLIEAVI